MSVETIITATVQLILIGVFAGWIKASIAGLNKSIDRLEKKQDKHNSLIERMVVVEQATKSAHNRLDRLVNK